MYIKNSHATVISIELCEKFEVDFLIAKMSKKID